MSYILDALKKIEHEKNRKADASGKISISGDLFHDRSRPTARTGVWKIVALIAAASLVTSAGTWFVLRGNSKKNAAYIRAAAPSPPPAAVNPPVVTPPVPLPVQPQATPVAVPPTVPSAAVSVAPNSTDVVDDEDSSSRESRRSKKRSNVQRPSTNPTQATQATQAAQTVQAPADLILSGIAWQDERSARRAVINGFLLKEGAVVGGAKIIDIKADRVRFSSAAGPFEIKLDAVLPAEVKK